MNAAITTHPADAFPSTIEVPSTESAPSEPRSFASHQAQSMTICMLGVFVGTALIHYTYQGGLAQALGLATYLGIWIGGGFGFLVGGVRWGLEYVDADQRH